MKILELNVFSFGGIKEEKIYLGDGLNCFVRENGYGKTTLAVFIKSIFYGLNDNKFSLKENERKKYKPWNSTEKFGGSILFEKSGVRYKVLRLFGTKNSQDEFTLTEVDSNKIISENGDGFGEKLFGVDQVGFLSTVYHCQADFEIKDGAILADKNATENSFDYDFERAIFEVENKAKTYKAERGEKGLIPQLKNRIFALDEKINELNKVSDMIVALKKSEKKYETEVESLRLQLKNLSDSAIKSAGSQRIAEKQEQLNSLLTDKTQLLNDIKCFDLALNGRETTKEEVEAYLDCAKDYISAKAKIDVSVDTKDRESKKTGVFTFISLVLAFVFGALGIVGLFFNDTLAIVGFTLCAVFTLCGIIVKIFNKNKPKNEGHKTENGYAQICKTYYSKLNSFISGFNTEKSGDFISDLLVILSVLEKRNNAKKLLALTNTKIDAIKLEIGNNSNEFCDLDLAKLKVETENKQSAYSLAQEKLQTTRAQIAGLVELECALPDLVSEKEEVSAKLQEAKTEYETLKLTAEYLKISYENMKVRYRKPLEERLNYYLTKICGEKFSKASIDVDLKVKIEFLGKERESDYFSKGIGDVVNIAKRMALSDVIFNGEVPFVIMDDPFYNLDDNRLNLAIDTVKMLAKDRQIIYFTCHESRRIN